MIHRHENILPALHNIEDFSELPPCGIEDVDRSVFELFNSVLPLQLETDGEVYAVPCESSDADSYTRLAEILNSSASERGQESERSVQSEVKTARLLDFARS